MQITWQNDNAWAGQKGRKALTTAQLVQSDQGYSVSLFAQALSHLQNGRQWSPARVHLQFLCRRQHKHSEGEVNMLCWRHPCPSNGFFCNGDDSVRDIRENPRHALHTVCFSNRNSADTMSQPVERTEEWGWQCSSGLSNCEMWWTGMSLDVFHDLKPIQSSSRQLTWKKFTASTTTSLSTVLK